MGTRAQVPREGVNILSRVNRLDAVHGLLPASHIRRSCSPYNTVEGPKSAKNTKNTSSFYDLFQNLRTLAPFSRKCFKSIRRSTFGWCHNCVNKKWKKS